MGPDRLTPELLERCHKAFVMWDANLFSFPVNLPGFGRSATCSTAMTFTYYSGSGAI